MPTVCLAQATQFTLSTVVGNGTQGFFGDGQSPTGTNTELNSPVAVVVDSSGDIYISDAGNNRIRKVSGGKINTYAGNGVPQFSGDGSAATGASLADPQGIALDQKGNLYIADLNNQVVRMVSSGGTISTFAGQNSVPPQFCGDGGPATGACFNQPTAVAVDSDGNVYVADNANYCIREITTDGNINTVAGTPTVQGFSGDGGPARQATLRKVLGIAVDTAGNLYIADTGNNRVRMVSAADGKISTIAGNGTAASGGDGGSAISAQLNQPEGIAVDAAGAVYIAEKFGNRVRQVVNGTINTVAGSLGQPFGLYAASSGNVYIADFGANIIRAMAPNSPSVSGGVISAYAFGGFPSAAPGSWIEIYGTNLGFSRRSWATSDFSGSTGPTTLDGTSVTVGGQPAYIDYVSGGQVNVQVPSNVSTGSQQLIVKNAAGSSSSYNLTINSTQPGLLTQYKVGSVQYATALFNDGKTYVMPTGAVSGVTSRPAKAGDIITFFGIGFGPVTPAVAAGQVAPANNCILCINATLSVSIGGSPATIGYAGMTPGSVGLYQINVVVPPVTAGSAVPITFTLSGQTGTQTLYTAIQ